jgi:hypothetical protein
MGRQVQENRDLQAIEQGCRTGRAIRPYLPKLVGDAAPLSIAHSLRRSPSGRPAAPAKRRAEDPGPTGRCARSSPSTCAPRVAQSRITAKLLRHVPVTAESRRESLAAMPYIHAHLATHVAKGRVLDQLAYNPQATNYQYNPFLVVLLDLLRTCRRPPVLAATGPPALTGRHAVRWVLRKRVGGD